MLLSPSPPNYNKEINKGLEKVFQKMCHMWKSLAGVVWDSTPYGEGVSGGHVWAKEERHL
jgi:hypothetical protein